MVLSTPSKHLQRAGRRRGAGTRGAGKSATRQLVEFIVLIGWLGFIAWSGYTLGLSSGPGVTPVDTAEAPCDPTLSAEASKFVSNTMTYKETIPNTIPDGICDGFNGHESTNAEGHTFAELQQQWSCAWIHANSSQVHQHVKVLNGGLSKTKWSSIITMDPKNFASTYMSQYPRDTRITQPVVVFSHRPLENQDKLQQTCKVLDVAIVPDTPGTCVSVTETFHDVASYHMLHAERTNKGNFVLAANAIQDRHVPGEKDYDVARDLLKQYFIHRQTVENAVASLPKNKNKPINNSKLDAVACLIEDSNDLDLFKNSLAHAKKFAIRATIFYVFTTNGDVNKEAKNIGVKTIYIPKLASVGSNIDVTDNKLKISLRRAFLLAWFSFASAEWGSRILWQSPGTIWMSHPDRVSSSVPNVEVSWSYKGHGDPRAAPFYISFDMFLATPADRTTHLLHEILLHFDLVVAWLSIDTVASYRLSENNSRYGTTSFILSPEDVLHIDAMGRKLENIKEVVELSNKDKPKVLVFPSELDGMGANEAIGLMKQVPGLWLL